MKRKLINIVSLITNSIIVLVLIGCMISYFVGKNPIGTSCFRYFTIDSNIYLALTSVGVIVINILNLTKKNKKIPHWVDIVRFTSVVGTMLTFAVVVCYLDFVIGFREMYTGANLFLHLVNPVLGLFSYVFIERHRTYKFWYACYGLIPVILYGIVYLIFVFGIHAWKDFYHFNINGLLPLILSVIILLTFGIGYIIIMTKRQINKSLMISKNSDNSLYHNAIESYIHKIYRFVIIMTALAGFAAGVTFTLCKALGEYKDVSNLAILLFDALCGGYLVFAIFYIIGSFQSNGLLKPNRLKITKIILCILIILQWNIITYLFPSTEFWAFSIFFVILTVFFFDFKLVFCVNLGIILSIVISWIINGNLLITSDNIVSVIILRCVCLTFSSITLQLITYFGGNLLVKELEKISESDPLTGLYNRRNMYKEIDVTLAKEKAVTLAMIDVDDFKNINDKYGHENGDEVLKTLALIIKTNLRSVDRAYRYGGEEFLILIDGDKDFAYTLINKMVNEIKENQFKFGKQNCNITVTCGLADNTEANETSRLIDIADSYLYIGKNKGKNQIIVKKTDA